jgi:hypothetical protein
MPEVRKRRTKANGAEEGRRGAWAGTKVVCVAFADVAEEEAEQKEQEKEPKKDLQVQLEITKNEREAGAKRRSGVQ